MAALSRTCMLGATRSNLTRWLDTSSSSISRSVLDRPARMAGSLVHRATSLLSGVTSDQSIVQTLPINEISKRQNSLQTDMVLHL